MKFEKQLKGKVLDPIHGTIRLTDLEVEVINHKLFQRLRTVKQNTFLYKVFPSAMHSRFEHSIGVMHIAYRMIENLSLNSHRYNSKYKDHQLFSHMDKIDNDYIQEVRLAALLHDIGHGPMSHQFDSFLLDKGLLSEVVGADYQDIIQVIDDKVEHEHISLIFVRKIMLDIGIEKKRINNILSLIEPDFKERDFTFISEDSGITFDLHSLFTSLISSSPIDADRMDYLLRDSYFSGVKSGLYNIERLLMSIIPVQVKGEVCLAYKESSLDSVSEFVFSRLNLFSQVYYHKTNRAFSSMLDKVCRIVKNQSSSDFLSSLYGDITHKDGLDNLVNFYLDNSDDYFINETIPDLVDGDTTAESIVNEIVERKPWKKSV